MQGSAGVIVPPAGYLQKIREICTKHGILLIFDEVITGFGRMGANFGAQAFGVTPDLITFAKGVNNGTVPMGGVIAQQGIYDAFMQGPDYAVELFHGYTYSGHALAVAAAHATLDLLERDKLAERFLTVGKWLEEGVHGLKGLPNVIDTRNFACSAAVEMSPLPGTPGLRAIRVFEKALEQGLLLRFTGDTIALAPPAISTEAEIATLFDVLATCIKAAA
jgi:beta-alanine--pyruvate transaminase